MIFRQAGRSRRGSKGLVGARGREVRGIERRVRGEEVDGGWGTG